jgi:CYTH domain-containing protein
MALNGEWWIDDTGVSEFADDNIGDYNHAMHAFEGALGVSLEDPNAPEIIMFEPLTNEAIEWLRSQKASEEALEYLKDGSDPRDYAMERLGWIRVQDGNFQVQNFDDEALSRIAGFLFDEVESAEQSEDMVTIEQYSNNELFILPIKLVVSSAAVADGLKTYANKYGKFREDLALELIRSISEDLVPKFLAILEDEDIQKEYEQRFELKSIPKNVKGASEIKQGLLFDKPGCALRIREEKTKNKEIVYTLTCKFFKKSDEAEVEITKEMFDKLWPETISSKRMEKTRYRFGSDWVIDDIRTPESEKRIVAEIETGKKDQAVELPSEFEEV